MRGETDRDRPELGSQCLVKIGGRWCQERKTTTWEIEEEAAAETARE